MSTLVRHYLRVEPAQGLEELLEQYVEALWIEERQVDVTAAVVAKAFNGRKSGR